MGYCKNAFPALVFCVLLTLVLAACGGGGGGAPKTGGASTLTAQSAADIANCPTGGVALDYGIDDNKNGTLDASEIDGTEYICNGTDGLTALVATFTADVVNCPAGGTMIEIGIDANSNDVLDPGEVDPALTDYICNPTAPANTAPVADAGPDQTASAGYLVTLDGSGSSDAEDPITYMWSFIIRPPGSTAVLNDTSVESPTFTADVEGTYALSLSVSDGKLYSAADYVTITPRSWTGAAEIEAGTYSAYLPQVAFDANGNAIAVWYQWDGTSANDIYANLYNGTGWTGTMIIDAGDYSADSPQVAFDAGGNAIAVWRQYDGTSAYDIYANLYNGTGWGAAELIETGSNNASAPQVAFDANGNAIAVWYQWDGTRYNVYANRYVAGTGWGTAELIETGVNNADSPQVAVDAGGNAIAVWRQYDGASAYDIYANIYNGTDWEGAELIEAGANNASSPQVAFDAGGNALAVWRQYDGTYWRIYANRYVAGTGWTGAEIIEAGAYDASYPQVAFDSGGNAIAVWRQWDGTSAYDIHANRYVAGTGWTGAVIIDAGVGSADAPQVAFDSGGNALAVWKQDYGIYQRIYANRYVAGTGWTGPVIIDAGTDNASSPQVAFDSGGNAFSVWTQTDGTYWSIYANRYE